MSGPSYASGVRVSSFPLYFLTKLKTFELGAPAHVIHAACGRIYRTNEMLQHIVVPTPSSAWPHHIFPKHTPQPRTKVTTPCLLATSRNPTSPHGRRSGENTKQPSTDGHSLPKTRFRTRFPDSWTMTNPSTPWSCEMTKPVRSWGLSISLRWRHVQVVSPFVGC